MSRDRGLHGAQTHVLEYEGGAGVDGGHAGHLQAHLAEVVDVAHGLEGKKTGIRLSAGGDGL